MAGPDIVLYIGKVVTMDEKFSIAEALAVRYGRIQKVGSKAEIRALCDSNTKERDLEGRAVFPGFINTHPHIKYIKWSLSRSVPFSRVWAAGEGPRHPNVFRTILKKR